MRPFRFSLGALFTEVTWIAVTVGAYTFLTGLPSTIDSAPAVAFGIGAVVASASASIGGLFGRAAIGFAMGLALAGVICPYAYVLYQEINW